MRSPWSLLFQAKQAQHSQPFFIGEVLQPPDHLHSPPLDPLQKLYIIPVLGAPGLDTVFQMGPHKGRVEGDSLLPLPAATPLLTQPKIPLAFWAARALCWLMSSFSPTRTPRSFSAGLLSSSSLNLYAHLRFSQPKCNTLHLILLNLIQACPVPSG